MALLKGTKRKPKYHWFATPANNFKGMIWSFFEAKDVQEYLINETNVQLLGIKPMGTD